MLAADSQVSDGGLRFASSDKIARSPSGAIGGACGLFVNVAAFLAWVREGAKDTFDPPEEGHFSAILIKPALTRDTVFIYEKGGCYEVHDDFVATGSGQEVAIGALAMGATAEEAVEIAKQFHTGCGGRTQVLRFRR